MKNILAILFFLTSISSFAQQVLPNFSKTYDTYLQGVDALEDFLVNTFQLEKNNLVLNLENQNESLAANHYTFSLFKNERKIHALYFKAHVNKEGKLFLVQHNYQEKIFENISTKPINLDAIKRALNSKYIIHSLDEVYVYTQDNILRNAVKISNYQEQEDIYQERIYFSETDFIEKDLKVYFAPKDTMLKGKVFLPDPLTSSGNYYGGNYSDKFEKDTSVLFIKTISNIGQEPVSSGMSSYTLYGTTFNVEEFLIQNTFTNSTLYFVFDKIFLDANGSVLGYKTTIVEDTLGSITQLITEDYGYAELDAEQKEIEVLGDYSGGQFHLRNTVFEILDFSLPVAPPYTSATNDFSFSRANKFFEGINTFYHLNNFHNYVEQLGFKNLDPQKLFVDVHANNGLDNSAFINIPSPRLMFGDGGVDDAEDADVIVHEYTHALSYFAAPNSNQGAERKALDEAYGDYFASSYSAQYANFNKYDIFSWDGHNPFFGGRITNSEKSYVDFDLAKSIYYNGQIMSSTLMDVFDAIGKEVTDALVLESLYYNVPENTFKDAAKNILLADSLLFSAKYKCEIFNVFKERKLLEGFCVGNKLTTNEGLSVLNSAAFSQGTTPVEFYITDKQFQHLDYWISDALGRIVHKQKGLKTNTFSLAPQDFNLGIYYVYIQTNTTKYKTKLIKLK